jgi:hypothetical protein
MPFQPYDHGSTEPPDYPVRIARRPYVRRHPLRLRLLAMFGGFLLLIPVMRVFGSSGGHVRTSADLVGGAMDATPIAGQLDGADGSTTDPSADPATDASADDPSATDPSNVTYGVGTLPARGGDASTAGDPTANDAAASAPVAAPQPNATTKPAATKPATTKPATAKPATTKPATTVKPAAKPATTVKPAVKPVVTTKAPAKTTVTTKPKPTTTPAPTAPPRVYGADEIVNLIRSMWPADSVDHALAIAWRESNYQPGVHNSCCYGLFQINAYSHAARLSAHGWTIADLYDPVKNITIALELYSEAGWGPWGG